MPPREIAQGRAVMPLSDEDEQQMAVGHLSRAERLIPALDRLVVFAETFGVDQPTNVAIVREQIPQPAIFDRRPVVELLAGENAVEKAHLLLEWKIFFDEASYLLSDRSKHSQQASQFPEMICFSDSRN